MLGNRRLYRSLISDITSWYRIYFRYNTQAHVSIESRMFVRSCKMNFDGGEMNRASSKVDIPYEYKRLFHARSMSTREKQISFNAIITRCGLAVMYLKHAHSPPTKSIRCKSVNYEPYRCLNIVITNNFHNYGKLIINSSVSIHNTTPDRNWCLMKTLRKIPFA